MIKGILRYSAFGLFLLASSGAHSFLPDALVESQPEFYESLKSSNPMILAVNVNLLNFDCPIDRGRLEGLIGDSLAFSNIRPSFVGRDYKDDGNPVLFVSMTCGSHPRGDGFLSDIMVTFGDLKFMPGRVWNKNYAPGGILGDMRRAETVVKEAIGSAVLHYSYSNNLPTP